MAMKDYDFNEVFANFVNIISDYSSLGLRRENITDGENFIIENGCLKKESGYKYVRNISTVLDNIILSLPIYLKYSGDKAQLAITSSSLYHLTQTEIGFVWDQKTNQLGGQPTDIVSYINMNDLFLFVNSSVGIIKKYDGISVANLFSSPNDTNRKARFIVEHNGSLVLVRTIENGTENYQRLWWSYPYVPTEFDPYDKLDIPQQLAIENAMTLEGYIIVYTRKGIFRIPDLTTVDTITNEIGIIAPKSLASDGVSHYFLSQEGIMRLKGGTLMPLSSKRFNKLLLDDMDSENYWKAIGVFIPSLHQYRLIFPKKGTTYNNKMLIYDTLADELIGIEFFQTGVTCLSSTHPEILGKTEVGDVFILGTADKTVWEKISIYQRINSSYLTRIILKKEIFGDILLHKRILAITLTVSKTSNSDLQLKFILTNEKNVSKTYTATIKGEAGKEITKTFYTHFIGKEFTIEIQDVSNTQGFSIKDIVISGNYLTRL